MKQKLHMLPRQEREEVKDRIARVIAGQSEIVFATIYGSFIEEAPFHDIDVGVYLAADRDLSFAAELAAALQKETGFPIDVRILNSAPIPFLFHAVKGDLLVDRDEDIRAEVVENAIRRYLDIKPILKQAVREAFAA